MGVNGNPVEVFILATSFRPAEECCLFDPNQPQIPYECFSVQLTIEVSNDSTESADVMSRQVEAAITTETFFPFFNIAQAQLGGCECIVKDPCTSDPFTTLFVVRSEYTVRQDLDCEARFDVVAFADVRGTRCTEEGNLRSVLTKNGINYIFDDVYTDRDAYNEHQTFQYFTDFLAVAFGNQRFGDPTYDGCVIAQPVVFQLVENFNENVPNGDPRTFNNGDPLFPPPTTQLSCSR